MSCFVSWCILLVLCLVLILTHHSPSFPIVFLKGPKEHKLTHTHNDQGRHWSHRIGSSTEHIFFAITRTILAEKETWNHDSTHCIANCQKVVACNTSGLRRHAHVLPYAKHGEISVGVTSILQAQEFPHTHTSAHPHTASHLAK